jgi:hypothetical protein
MSGFSIISMDTATKSLKISEYVIAKREHLYLLINKDHIKTNQSTITLVEKGPLVAVRNCH